MKNFFVLFLFVTSVVSAAEGYRDHDAHMHGHAKMTLVVSGNILEIELDTPAMNLLYFEHRAHSKSEKKKLTDTVEFLNKASNWVGIDKNAGCKVTNMQVASELLKESGHDHGHEHEGHSDFEMAVKYTCSDVEKLQSVSFSGLFDNFKGLEEIDMQWLTDRRQSAAELDARNTEVTLK